ncbi:uncharacterized protein CIMG_03749 [Coccidioides immitis RS]|uniref:Uncharacterized protein n=1 Tax=Coccidioides immitis (strain RS) TaxID=246410 RepID=J3KC12_COCIM|nr:uncharacterized protein CIMG_03749 [Coccidioides immitis RS]EAS32725.3 hypothetical protein CIMG_03749 [Coccidioides immitis RS]
MCADCISIKAADLRVGLRLRLRLRLAMRRMVTWIGSQLFPCYCVLRRPQALWWGWARGSIGLPLPANRGAEESTVVVALQL